ncbi:hypothetical protein VM1G_10063 [Cytospora mali]|uniref:C2H2-type domain-containing protein n=1 Tax=Cytospora mali TaxID=578113 RepID=A0A194WE46_CYTMA|nr:hypothetical protein VM1G_10063 [Valsa mali]
MSMSVSTNIERGALSLQPYQCPICHSRFTRHENLKRHAALHSRSRSNSRSGGGSLPCHLCPATFSRPDLRKRHMRRKHPEHGNSNGNDNNIGMAHSVITESKSLAASFSADTMSGSSPAEAFEPASLLDNIISYQQAFPEVSSADSSIGAGFSPGHNPVMLMRDLPSPLYFGPSLTTSFDFGLPQLQLHGDWMPTTAQTDEGCRLYFTHVAYYVPVLHRPTFDPRNPPARHLLLAILCLAYQYSEDPDCSYEAGSGDKLSLRCFQSARAILTALEEDLINGPVSKDTATEKVAVVQSYLLLQIYTMLYMCCNSSDSANGLPMHSKMISLTRAGGLMQPLPVEVGSAAPKDLESLWRQFAKNESHKRTLFAVHQIDALWYQLLSVPRSISHLEIKHDLPCPEDYWTAPSSTEWAHRQLLTAGYSSGAGTGTVQYAVAVRRLLSPPDPELISLPAFDAYGAINIAQFLISSAREISGWSTMTGTLSMERLEPLKSSLVALKPSIHPQPETAKATHAALTYEATWEMATIEMQLWSPLHTEGIVGGDIDALLSQSTHAAAAAAAAPNMLLYEPDTAQAIQPHVDWFLHYLEAALSPDLEAPWIPLYAYKAFLIAWQLLQGGISGAMRVSFDDDSGGKSVGLY